MQVSHAYVAAKLTESILDWFHAAHELDEAHLRRLFDLMYYTADGKKQHALANGGYETWKETTFDGVRLAYRHFHDGNPHHFQEIKRYLVSVGSPDTWLALAK